MSGHNYPRTSGEYVRIAALWKLTGRTFTGAALFSFVLLIAMWGNFSFVARLIQIVLVLTYLVGLATCLVRYVVNMNRAFPEETPNN